MSAHTGCQRCQIRRVTIRMRSRENAMGMAGNLCYCLISVSCSVVPDSLQLHGLQPTRLLCPWDFLGRDTGVGCHCLPQGIFPNQGSNSDLLHCGQILYHLSHQGTVEFKSIFICSGL